MDRKESRPGEWMIRKFFGAFYSGGPSSMSVTIDLVGKAMVSNTVLQSEQKTEILENKAIAVLGKSTEK